MNSRRLLFNEFIGGFFCAEALEILNCYVMERKEVFSLQNKCPLIVYKAVILKTSLSSEMPQMRLWLVKIAEGNSIIIRPIIIGPDIIRSTTVIYMLQI